MCNISHRSPYKKGNKTPLLCVGLFLGYIQVCPLPKKSAETQIKAIDTTIVEPFDVPKFLQSDQETGLLTISTFY
jgi:hypothetical protein